MLKSEFKEHPNNRVVILGASGFIGKAISNFCQLRQVDVTEISRKEIDLSAPDAHSKLKKILKRGDHVVIAAAKAPVKNITMLIENLKLTEQLLKAFSEIPPLYVLNISSDAVYEDSSNFLNESSTRAPDSLHGAMHLARELSLQKIQAKIGVLCPTLVYGISDPHNGYGPNQFSRLLNKSQPITLFGKGEEKRDHIFIDDVAELAYGMLSKKICGRINAATGNVISFLEIANICTSYSKNNNRINFLERNGPMPHNGYRAFDISKIKLIFPEFKPTPIKVGLGTLF